MSWLMPQTLNGNIKNCYRKEKVKEKKKKNWDI